ncbi:hypothetical protein [Thalassobaculum sp.]|uniref:hypothetical protein n=1 Tax=Thalassobaculum sp. TaxID=2022740 RepID=UPI0032EC165B
MSMVKWIDITSPTLRNVHQIWCEMRGDALIPHLKSYNTFLPVAHNDDTICAIFPAQSGSPAFRSVGVNLVYYFPDVSDGLPFAQIKSIIARTALTVPFHEVCSNRQPDCRRAKVGGGLNGRSYEQLLMPFGDDHLRVCLVHALFEFSAGQ